jgi:hypothetical protein
MSAIADFGNRRRLPLEERIDCTAMIRIRRSIVPSILIIVLLTPLFAQTSPWMPEPDKDPFVGTWKANAEKSRPKLDKVDASYVRTLSREGDDLVFSSRMKKPHSAGFVEYNHRIRCDGSPHIVERGVLPITTSCIYATTNRVEGVSVVGDKTSYWAEEVSSDGQEIRIYEYKNKTRTKLSSTRRALDRVK